MRCAGTTLANGVRRLAGCRHRSPVLLVALIRGVLFDVPLPPLFRKVSVTVAGCVSPGVGGLSVAGSFGAAIVGRSGWRFCHRVFPHIEFAHGATSRARVV